MADTLLMQLASSVEEHRESALAVTWSLAQVLLCLAQRNIVCVREREREEEYVCV